MVDTKQSLQRFPYSSYYANPINTLI